ncbi:MAG: SAM-dependent methyltransferase [Actinomycetota bacterium]
MAAEFTVSAIGHVHNERTSPEDDDWDSVVSTVVLDDEWFTPDVVAGLAEFSHLDIVFLFDRVDPDKVDLGARHPRNREDWPLVGIFAQRAKARPNRLGVTTCELLAVDGLTLTVMGLDAIDATPVLDIKPHMIEFQARTEVRQPAWVGELMAQYWERPD